MIAYFDPLDGRILVNAIMTGPTAFAKLRLLLDDFQKGRLRLT